MQRPDHRLIPIPATLVLAVTLLMAGSVRAADVPAKPAPPPASAPVAAPVPTSQNWPMFRGPAASGVLEGQKLPDTWAAEPAANVLWKVAIPGLAHSSPVVWGDRLFVTTAVSARDDGEFRYGLYGDGTTAADRVVPHQFKLYCLDKKSGKILWERIAFEGKPRSGRHIKSTYANASPATDGSLVLAFFGSEGLYAYDLDGNLKWKKDLGMITTSAYNEPDYEWGAASSPIFWKDLVIVQADTTTEDFLIALKAATGETAWRTERDEWPSWATPNVYEGPTGAELVTNAPKMIRGYDPATGKELWKLGPSSDITSPTPVFTADRILVTSGRRPVKPLFVLKPGARGDITLKEGQQKSDFVVWHKTGVGPYMPTPIVYQGLIYTLRNDGIFACYDLETGEVVYEQRLAHRGSGFSASPVAADGKLYVAGEDGDVFLIRAGRTFEQLAMNPMGEVVMATPALSDGRLYVRGLKHLFAVGR